MYKIETPYQTVHKIAAHCHAPTPVRGGAIRYSPKCVELAFSELRRHRILGSTFSLGGAVTLKPVLP
jgi:hypothetical protein